MFYVYTYRDPRPNKNNVIVYVGKGQNNRAFDHWRNPEKCKNRRLKNLLNLLRREAIEPIIEIVYRFETEREALDKEIELIALYGRADLKRGFLFNNTDGGEGTVNLGPEGKAKIGAAFKEYWQTAAYRKKCTGKMKSANAKPENKKRKQSNTKAGWDNEETRRKRIEGIRASQTPEMIAKRSASNKAAWTEEKRAEFSKKMQKQCQNPEHLERRANAAKEAWAKRKANWTEEDSKQKSETAKVAWAKRKADK